MDLQKCRYVKHKWEVFSHWRNLYNQFELFVRTANKQTQQTI